MKWTLLGLTCLLCCLSSIATATEQARYQQPAYLAEIAAGLSVRDGLKDRGPLDGVGPALRCDFGRHLGHNFYLLGSLGWAQAKGGEAEQVDSVSTGLSIRWALSFPDFEIFCQMGMGGLLDLVSLQQDTQEDQKIGLSTQLAFTASLGFNIRITGDVFLGLRTDSLMGDELVRANFAAFTGYRF